MSSVLRFFALLLFFASFNVSQAQAPDTLKSGKEFFRGKKIGFGFDIPFLSQEIYYGDGGYYFPLLSQFKLQLTYHKKPRRFFFSNCFIPQLNPVFIYYDKTIRMRFDGGLNIESALNAYLFGNTLFYLAIGAGPHYTNIDKGRQVGGFLFSDNVVWGLKFKTNKNLEMMINMRFRHISNANMKLPNNGINNYFVGMSFFKNITKK